MPSPLVSAVAIAWERNGGYGQRLVAHLTDAQWTAQPVPGRLLNHPAWVICHLAVYAPLAAAMLRGQPIEDPIDHPFGQRSEVSPDPCIYPARAETVAEYARLHEDALAALRAADPAVFVASTPLARWREKHPAVGDMIVALMVKHESGHLGQLSAWRRAMGLRRVAM